MQFVAADFAGCGMGQSFGDGLFDGADDQFRAEFLRAPVAEFNQLRKFVAGFDVKKRHRNVRRAERLLREAQQADGILAAGEEQGGALEFSGDLTHDVNRLGFQILQMVEMVRTHEKGMASGVWVLGFFIGHLMSGSGH